MRRRPRDIGTYAETAVVRAIVPRGFPLAERRSLRGRHDAGDITGTPGVCWSVKGGAAARTASDGQVLLWLRCLDDQVVEAKADVGVLVLPRPGIGTPFAFRWWAIMRLRTLHRLATGSDDPFSRWYPARLLLADACELLTLAGYGEKGASCCPTSTSPPR
jgi:hypothetical protein